ncbi:MAG: Gfo/Idh/MocA family oxidoreductase [Verrucomicrobia bacterium]|nr:MAG: Gfo/Idh/MocA family oxidoreductase [Verrucomicrobiota bacterium]
MNQFTRRQFLKSSALVAATAAVTPTFTSCKTSPRNVHARVRGANEDIRVAVIGLNGRGKAHLEGFSKVKGVRLVAVCDVDQNVLDRTIQKLKDDGPTVQGFQDIRKLLASPDIDAVSLATPNHWHSLGAIWAMQAGKDVYVEKPLSHNVWEGRKVVEAAHKYQRIVQTGSQIRSGHGVREGIEWIRAGNLGKIICARGFCYKRRESIGKADKPFAIPPTIDADLWFGPAQKEPIMRKRLHYDWHWVWPTGNGDLGNQGVHQVDLARWALSVNELSPRVFSLGGRLGYEDDGTTPNTQIIFHDYAPAPLIFEVRGLPASSATAKMDQYRGVDIGAVIDCEGGYLQIPSYTSAVAFDKDGKEIKKFSGSESHFANFIQAVRSRKESDLTANALEGHLSAALCHTGNISYQLGQRHSPDEIRDAVKNNSVMADALGRMEEHLGANAVDLQKTPATLGEVLTMNPQTERFIRNDAANARLTREYRAPFVVSERV